MRDEVGKQREQREQRELGELGRLEKKDGGDGRKIKLEFISCRFRL